MELQETPPQEVSDSRLTRTLSTTVRVSSSSLLPSPRPPRRLDPSHRRPSSLWHPSAPPARMRVVPAPGAARLLNDRRQICWTVFACDYSSVYYSTSVGRITSTRGTVHEHARFIYRQMEKHARARTRINIICERCQRCGAYHYSTMYLSAQLFIPLRELGSNIDVEVTFTQQL